MSPSFYKKIDLSPKQFKLKIIQKVSGCNRCSPHKGCNQNYRTYRVKKAFQLDIKKRHRIL